MNLTTMQEIDRLERRGIYIWLKPIFTGPKVIWAGHVAFDGEHYNVGNYESRELAYQQTISFANDAVKNKNDHD